MKNWKHITFEQRKTISSCIAHNYKLIEISKILGFNPTTISREVKRNRTLVNSQCTFSKCPKLERWPFVCNYCSKVYKPCYFAKYKYIANIAQNHANENLIISRRGIDIDSENFHKLDKLIKTGIDNNKSLYQIKIENNDIIDKSITTLYRYVNNGYLTTKRIDLPYAVTYKKRKHNKKYDYSNNKIDRSNHTYLDYLSFIKKNPGIFVWQLDFLGSIKTDSKSILTFILPNIHFSLLAIIKTPNSSKVVKYFDDLEEKIGLDNFKDLIPVILTDRDPCFNDINGICFSKITGEERCQLFFCDPYVSNQKPNVENMNKQIRKFFPKKASINKFSKEEITQINYTLNNTPLRSLDSYTPNEAFSKLYDEELLEKLYK